ncbi:MAG TPA: MFS transporter [Thermoanaerobaculaceae bacterium]|nr:MFS transporter [Thermoanaerobaculaceae bacterium]
MSAGLVRPGRASERPTGAASQSVLALPAFRWYWLARMASSIALQMQAVGVGWQVYDLTGSAWYLGLVGLAQFLPRFFLTLPVGHVADRYDRRLVSRACQLVECLAAGALALGSFAGRQTEHAILLIVVVAGAARAFEGPAMQALAPDLVPVALIPRAAAWSTSANQTATILGPALGGVLYALGPGVVYAAASALFLAAGVCIALIRGDRAGRSGASAGIGSLFAGIAFIRRQPAILGAISLDLFAVLLGGATALLPIYARDILSTGPWGLGLLRAAPAAGALAMAVFLARRPLRRRVGRTMFGAVGVFGVATAVFAVSRSFPLSLAALAVLGAADVISVVIRSALVQIRTPEAMRGRVSAVNSMFIGTSNQLGEFESGATAALFGTVPAVLIGGVGTLVVAGLWMALFPQLLDTDTLES